MTPKSRIKCKHEESVLKGMYLGGAVRNREFLRFGEIELVQSMFYHKIKKSRLQTVLERLVRRGWVEKIERYSFTGLNPNESKIYNDVSFWRKKNSERFHVHIPEILAEYHEASKGKSIKTSMAIFNKLIKRETSKKYSFYKIIKYPFFFSVNGENINVVPDGTKRFWQDSAKELRILRQRNKIPFWLPTPKTKVIREGSKQTETKMKVLEIKNGKYKLQDPNTKEITEIDESEIIKIPNKSIDKK